MRLAEVCVALSVLFWAGRHPAGLSPLRPGPELFRDNFRHGMAQWAGELEQPENSKRAAAS